ncbi:hypothetical protein CBR_g12841 [Chara braunii]|uniref:Uncharacterized protein n=1 Tax=Chara braunii TaxID=69332 RepID=A0A388KST7_CHABU|nr:hypothetical protein CBR_g12841 [Chara braunii]|eukprot:GBG73124.1 hypothetical protein CBR_g12841 [Chara braunii]
MGAVSTGMADHFRFKAVAMTVLVLAMCMASSPVAVADAPKDYCDFYLHNDGRDVWKVILPQRKGDKVYLSVGVIRHWESNEARKVKVANSRSCKYSDFADCCWQEVECSHMFKASQAWLASQNFNGQDLGRFLNKYIRVQISAAQYKEGDDNFNSDGDERDCLTFKTGDHFV